MEVQERCALAQEYFHKGFNCAQSVVLAFSDVTGLSEEDALKASAGFGGGIGRMREVCGCVCGMAFVAGFVKPFTDPAAQSDKKECYVLVQQVADEYRQSNGSIICRELLAGECAGQISPEPAPRTDEYYRKRPCVDLVADAVRILAAHL